MKAKKRMGKNKFKKLKSMLNAQDVEWCVQYDLLDYVKASPLTHFTSASHSQVDKLCDQRGDTVQVSQRRI